jgi:hypothetical protein
MMKQFAQLGRLLALALFALTTAHANAYDWPRLYDPLQMLTLNLDMGSRGLEQGQGRHNL